MPKKQSFTIETYDADGVLRESIGGPMDFDDVCATMTSILKNDGLPVIRQLGKHACPQDACGKHAVKETTPPQPVLQWEPPMCIHIEYDGAKFSATGKYEDVMDAQAEFLKAIFEED